MPTGTQPTSKKMLWAGRIISFVPALMLLASAIMKLVKHPAVVEGLSRLGYAERLVRGLGVVELACTVLYLIPQTSILGASLLTGYLGGAIATHLSFGDSFLVPLLLGVLLWLGLYLRDPRLRALLPLRR